jgi:threonine dehydratase
VRDVRPPERGEVLEAERRIRPHLRPTPLVASPSLAPGALLKLETLQPTGSFKVRGALAALTRVAPGERVVTASAGNHALGVAWAAAALEVAATVVVPETAAPPKLAALERFPVELVRHGRSYDEAERHALALAATGRRYVSAYNDPDVIAGQATVAVELLDELLGEPLTIVCPVGGGGLCAGVALWTSAVPGVRVVGVEAEASQAMSAALAAGRAVPVEVRPTLADGLAGNLEPGAVTVGLICAHVAEIVAVTEAELEEAIRFLAG